MRAMYNPLGKPAVLILMRLAPMVIFERWLRRPGGEAEQAKR